MPSFELRPYQKECVDKICESFRTNNLVGVVLSTGSGKTEIFSEVTRRYLKAFPNETVLILSHLSILTTQTKERMKLRIGIEPGILQASIYPRATDRVVISTMQSSRDENKIEEWYRISNQGNLFTSGTSKKPSLIIIDEAHRLMSESYDNILSYFPNARVLGVTATPFRSGHIMTHFFDEIAYAISLQELIDMGYLVPPKLIEVKYVDAELSTRMISVIKTYKEKEAGKKAVVFMKTIEDAKLLRNVFVDNGINARAITSELVGDYRDSILKDFCNGDISVLTTVNVLTEGFDAPPLEVIFMPYATKSPTQYMQRIGRGLRPYKDKKECRVYCYGTDPEIKKGEYQRLNKVVLNKFNKESNNIHEELEYLQYDKDSEVYKWTKEIANISKKMERFGYKTLSDMLINKKFPPKFLKNVMQFHKALPKTHKVHRGHAPASDKQVGALKRNGFTDQQANSLTKSEASYMISTIMNMNGVVRKDTTHTLKEGKYKGRHVSELPHLYKQVVLTKFPNSVVAKQILAWQQRYK